MICNPLAVATATSALVLAWVAILLLCLALGALVRQVRALQLANTSQAVPKGGPRPGSRMPEVSDGTGALTAILFLSSNCATCDLLRVKLPTLIAGLTARVRVVLVLKGDAEPTPVEDATHRVIRRGDDLFDKYQVRAAPFGVILAESGEVLLAEAIGSVQALERLVENLPQEVQR